MIPNSFPRTQGQLSREQYLTLLLLALLEQQPDKLLTISAPNLEKVDSGGKLLVDWDSPTQTCILRIGTPSLVVAEVRGSGWTTLNRQPAQQPSPADDPAKHRPPLTDQQIVDFVEKMKSEARMKEWRREGADAVANMPPPDSEPIPGQS